MTALIWAALMRRTRVVGRLIEAGADVNARGDWGVTALYAAAQRDNGEIITALLEAKADPNLATNYTTGGAQTPLQAAVAARARRSAKALVDGGADLEFRGADGSMALIQAARLDDLELVKLLVEAGASVESVDASGRTAFMTACQNGSVAVVRHLRATGSWMHLRTTDGLTALHIAANTGNTPVLKQLLEWKELDVDVRSGDGLTPLHYAARKASYAACKLLLEAGANVNAEYNDNGGIVTVAALASADGEPKLMQLLLDWGLVFFADPKGGPLTFAALEGNRRMYEFLLKAGKGKWSKEEMADAKRYLAEVEAGKAALL
jgi:ankyrin repeat protein